MIVFLNERVLIVFDLKIFEIIKIIEFNKKYTDSKKRKWKYAGCRDYI